MTQLFLTTLSMRLLLGIHNMSSAASILKFLRNDLFSRFFEGKPKLFTKVPGVQAYERYSPRKQPSKHRKWFVLLEDSPTDRGLSDTQLSARNEGLQGGIADFWFAYIKQTIGNQINSDRRGYIGFNGNQYPVLHNFLSQVENFQTQNKYGIRVPDRQAKIFEDFFRPTELNTNVISLKHIDIQDINDNLDRIDDLFNILQLFITTCVLASLLVPILWQYKRQNKHDSSIESVMSDLERQFSGRYPLTEEVLYMLHERSKTAGRFSPYDEWVCPISRGLPSQPISHAADPKQHILDLPSLTSLSGKPEQYKSVMRTYGFEQQATNYSGWQPRLDVHAKLFAAVLTLSHCDLNHGETAGTLFHRRRPSAETSNNQLASSSSSDVAKGGSLFHSARRMH